jgi:hypothetical protein
MKFSHPFFNGIELNVEDNKRKWYYKDKILTEFTDDLHWCLALVSLPDPPIDLQSVLDTPVPKGFKIKTKYRHDPVYDTEGTYLTYEDVFNRIGCRQNSHNNVCGYPDSVCVDLTYENNTLFCRYVR